MKLTYENIIIDKQFTFNGLNNYFYAFTSPTLAVILWVAFY